MNNVNKMSIGTFSGILLLLIMNFERMNEDPVAKMI